MNKLFIPCLQIAIVTCAISVSISQLFLFFTLILFFITQKRPYFRFTPISILSLGIFVLYFISFFYHLIQGGDLNYFSVLKGSELKDVLLWSAFLVLQGVKTEEEIKKIENAFWILLIVLLVTGLISIFSPIRLARLITDLIKPSTAWKFTHHYGNLLGIGLHLPIGLMNTHLTFGGILLLFAPYVFFRFVFSIRDRKEVVFHSLILFAFGVITLLNNARSSMLGALVSILIGFVDLLFIQKYFSIKNTLKLITLPLLGVVVLVGLLFFNETMAKTIQPLLGQEKHTDSGRTFIWTSTYPMIQENPIFGIGPGNYAKEVEITRKKLSTQYEELLFFFEVTQRGHAHSDFLHLAAIAGLPTMLIYILLGSMICYGLLLPKKSRSDHILFYGLVGFFFAGLFQCYFQDDEVVIVFWYLLGFFHVRSVDNVSST